MALLRSFQEPSSSPCSPLPYIIAENNSTPKQTGKCLMILYPSMSSGCQWNIVPWAHISFSLLGIGLLQAVRGRGPGTKFKHHFTPSNKGANGRDGTERSVTWKGCRRWMGSSLLAICWLLVPKKNGALVQFSFCPSSLITSTNIHHTFLFFSFFFFKCFKTERQTFLLKIVSSDFRNSSHFKFYSIQSGFSKVNHKVAHWNRIFSALSSKAL